ncbi:MAG: hypothetical protein LBQ22_04250 [Bacteroidales bacterium]|jgi:V8-like Glu-specific endopeptidase|nr:hypothetical protein [Bacteroidales bacterium]
MKHKISLSIIVFFICVTSFSCVKERTVTFKNNSQTSVDVTFNDVEKTIEKDEEAVFTVEENNTFHYKAVTKGKTPTGKPLGMEIVWEDEVTTNRSKKNISFDVNHEYFFLKIQNNSSKEIARIFVNYEKEDETEEDFIIPANGYLYDVGYYKAHIDTRVSLKFVDSEDIFIYDVGSVAEPNQVIELIYK